MSEKLRVSLAVTNGGDAARTEMQELQALMDELRRSLSPQEITRAYVEAGKMIRESMRQGWEELHRTDFGSIHAAFQTMRAELASVEMDAFQSRLREGTRQALSVVEEIRKSARFADVASTHVEVSRQLAALAKEFSAGQRAASWAELADSVRAALAAAAPRIEQLSSAVPGPAPERIELEVSASEVRGSDSARRGDERGQTVVLLERDAGIDPRLGLAWFDSLPRYQRLFIIYFILYILPSVISAWIDSWLEESTPEQRQQVHAEFREFAGNDAATMLRCVRASRLRVRSSPDKAAAVIGYVVSQQAVVVLETRGAWSRIEYVDSSSRELRDGWAATAFLAQLAC